MRLLQDRGYDHPVASDITPCEVYEGRRTLLRQLAIGGAGLALGIPAEAQVAGPGKHPRLAGVRSAVSGAATMEISCANPIPFHVDGEPRLGPTRITMQTRRGALLVKVSD